MFHWKSCSVSLINSKNTTKKIFGKFFFRKEFISLAEAIGFYDFSEIHGLSKAPEIEDKHNEYSYTYI